VFVFVLDGFMCIFVEVVVKRGIDNMRYFLRMSLRSHALSIRTCVAFESKPTSMVASFARVTVWMGGVDTTMSLILISSAGKATIATMREGPMGIF
jgi:hypothetical protein